MRVAGRRCVARRSPARPTQPGSGSLGRHVFYITKWYTSNVFVARTRTFTRWMRKAGVTDIALRRAVSEMAQGLIDADLGGNLLKKRVALPGRGKRGGARTIVATRRAARWIFLYGFEKNERSNIDSDELKVLQEIAEDLLGWDEQQLRAATAAGELVEIGHGDQQEK